MEDEQPAAGASPGANAAGRLVVDAEQQQEAGRARSASPSAFHSMATLETPSTFQSSALPGSSAFSSAGALGALNGVARAASLDRASARISPSDSFSSGLSATSSLVPPQVIAGHGDAAGTPTFDATAHEHQLLEHELANLRLGSSPAAFPQQQQRSVSASRSPRPQLHPQLSAQQQQPPLDGLPRPADTRTQLFVGNLPYRVRWQDLKDLMRRCGTVLRADVSLVDGRSRGFGTVLFANAEDAYKAIEVFNGHNWQGRMLDVRLDLQDPHGAITTTMSRMQQQQQQQQQQGPPGGPFAFPAPPPPPPQMQGGLPQLGVPGMPSPQPPSRGHAMSPFGSPPDMAAQEQMARAAAMNAQQQPQQQHMFDNRASPDIRRALTPVDDMGGAQNGPPPPPPPMGWVYGQNGAPPPPPPHGGLAHFMHNQQRNSPLPPIPMPMQFANRNLFVGNLPFNCQWQELKDLMRAAGNVLRADVELGPDGRSRGWGRVVMATYEDAQRAVQMYNGKDFNGRVLKVHFDKYSTGIPPGSGQPSPAPGFMPSPGMPMGPPGPMPPQQSPLPPPQQPQHQLHQLQLPPQHMHQPQPQQMLQQPRQQHVFDQQHSYMRQQQDAQQRFALSHYNQDDGGAAFGDLNLPTPSEADSSIMQLMMTSRSDTARSSQGSAATEVGDTSTEASPGTPPASLPDEAPAQTSPRALRGQRHPTRIAMPPPMPFAFDSMMSPGARGLPPMTPSMPAFTFGAFPQQTPPPVPLHHFFSPGLGPFSPPLGSPVGAQSYPPWMNAAPGAPIHHRNGSISYSGPPHLQHQYVAPAPPTPSVAPETPPQQVQVQEASPPPPVNGDSYFPPIVPPAEEDEERLGTARGSSALRSGSAPATRTSSPHISETSDPSADAELRKRFLEGAGASEHPRSRRASFDVSKAAPVEDPSTISSSSSPAPRGGRPAFGSSSIWSSS